MAYDFKSSIWRGVYASFEEARGDTSVFEGGIWVDKISKNALAAVEEHKKQAVISANTAVSDYILPPIAAVLAKPGVTLRILDFGGGMAAGFYPLVDALGAEAKIEFHIVENPTICSLAGEILPRDERLFFHDKLPESGEAFDIVHIGSSLQYVEDWKGMLELFNSYHAKFMVFDGLTAGEIPETFASLQYYYGQEIPCWFFQISEFVSALCDNGYRLVFKSRFSQSFLGKKGAPPMDALPDTHRMPGFCHLAFCKNP